MKRNNAGLWVGFAMLLFVAIYSTIVFILKKAFNPGAWILYGFTLVAFLLVTIQLVASSRTHSSIFVNTAIGLVTAVYFGLQFVFGGIICMCFSNLAVTPVMIIEIILLAVYMIITFMIFALQSRNAEQNNAVKKIRSLENIIRTMMDEQNDSQLKQALKSLAEDIHFSNPIDHSGLSDVEGRIAQNVAILQSELTDENANPLARIEAIRRLVKERDRTAAILKR